MSKIKCLILDHDDTVVDSTRVVHYPAHLEMMRRFRPGAAPVSLETWFIRNFDPGITSFLKHEIGLSEEEMEREYHSWKEYTEQHVPDFYPGMSGLLQNFRAGGGIVTVVSHSSPELIRRDYRIHAGFEPERVFGWDFDETKRKPSPWPVRCILSDFGLRPEEALIVDDLKPAVTMARATGVRVAGAGWGHNIAPIREWMSKHCDYYLETVEDLKTLITTHNS
jgi:phosphoglycolate phosphatase/pyrophosphatase PpaX